MPKVVILPVNERTITRAVKKIMLALGWADVVSPDSKVVIKLNLSSISPETQKASNTDCAVIKRVCQVLRQRTQNIILVESDGMRYSAEEAFEKNGIYQLAEEADVEVRNLSKEPQVYGVHPLLEDFGLPRLLLEETDVFITLPVLKTHALTVFTGALKNQWGCIPRYDRILLHKHIDELIPILNKLFKPQIVIMDGIWGMEGRGPTSGKPRYMGVILGSCHPASLDATAMRLIGLDPYTARHVVLSAGEELGTIDADKIEIEGDFEELKTQFEPARLDWAVHWMNELSRYPFFVHQILLNPWIFRAGKGAVRLLRSIGIVR